MKLRKQGIRINIIDYIGYNNSGALDIIFNSCVASNDIGKIREMYKDLQSLKGLMSDLQYMYWKSKLEKALAEMKNKNEKDIS